MITPAGSLIITVLLELLFPDYGYQLFCNLICYLKALPLGYYISIVTIRAKNYRVLTTFWVCYYIFLNENLSSSSE